MYRSVYLLRFLKSQDLIFCMVARFHAFNQNKRVIIGVIEVLILSQLQRNIVGHYFL